MSDERTSPIKTPKQLVIVVALGFLVPLPRSLLLSQLIPGATRSHPGHNQRARPARHRADHDLRPERAGVARSTCPPGSGPPAGR